MDGHRAARLDIRNTGAALLDGSPAGWRLLRWHPEPLGGPGPDDPSAVDVTGERAEDVAGASRDPGWDERADAL